MGKRSIIKRSPLTRNQKVSYPYSKNNPRGRGRPRSSIRKKYKIKKQSKEDDSSYILPSNTEESVDFDKLDLEEETINSELNSPVIDLTQDDSEEEGSGYPYFSHGQQICRNGRRRSDCLL